MRYVQDEQQVGTPQTTPVKSGPSRIGQSTVIMSSDSCLKAQTESSTRPSMLLPSIVRRSKAANWESEDGTPPVKALSFSRISVRPVKSPRDAGI